jgi:hypothetical protein
MIFHRHVNQQSHATEMRGNYEPTAVYGSATDAKSRPNLS